MRKLIIELKARARDPEGIRGRLGQLGAQQVGAFHQIDTYFKVRRGRLKLRETEQHSYADIVYYERADVPDIKRSYILLIRAQPPDTAKELLARFFPTWVVVDKVREIYVLKKTRIHVDRVAQLGDFLEFERLTTDDPNEIKKSRTILTELSAKLGIKGEDFEALSYADLLIRRLKANQ